MTLAQAYDEILDFLAAGSTTDSVAACRPSVEAQERVHALIAQRTESGLSVAEEEELDGYLRLEHLMIMAKAGAQRRLQRP